MRSTILGIGLGVPHGFFEPAALLEYFMLHENSTRSHERTLIYLARKVTERPDRASWYSIHKNNYVTGECAICGHIVDENQRTVGKKTVNALDAHGRIHIEEALQGKYSS